MPTDLIPVLAKTIDAAAAKPGDLGLASEALPAACVLLLLDPSTAKLGNFWTVMNDASRQIFASEKFLSGCSAELLKSLALLVERLLTGHYDRMKPDSVRYEMYSPFLLPLFTSPSQIF